MKRSSIAAIMALVGMAGCSEHRITGQSVTDRTPWELLVLLLAAVVLYLVFSGVVALLSRPERVPHHRRHREGR